MHRQSQSRAGGVIRRVSLAVVSELSVMGRSLVRTVKLHEYHATLLKILAGSARKCDRSRS